jgi:hypothetical protein
MCNNPRIGSHIKESVILLTLDKRVAAIARKLLLAQNGPINEPVESSQVM